MIESLLQFLAPVRCVYCSIPKTLLCTEHLPESSPTPEKIQGLTGYFSHELDQPLLAALGAFKDRSMTALAPILAGAIGPLITTDLWRQAELIAIPPSSTKAYRSRGFVPVKLVLRNSRNQLPVNQLKLVRKVRDQRTLSAQERMENLAGAYRATGVAGKRVLLFDDVLTTSATLQEMHRAVVAAGAKVTGFCVLARRFPESGDREKIKA